MPIPAICEVDPIRPPQRLLRRGSGSRGYLYRISTWGHECGVWRGEADALSGWR